MHSGADSGAGEPSESAIEATRCLSRDVEVCVVGSCNADVVVRAPRLPAPGETVLGSTVETFLGGKGFNQAVAAARAGARTAMVAALGGDEHGAALRAVMAGDGIDASHVRDAGDVGTGMAIVLVDDAGENSIIVVPRANATVSVDDVSGGVVGAANVVLLQLEIPVVAVAAAATTGRDGGATVVLNPAPAVADLTPFVGVVDVVVPNETELLALAGPGPTDPASAAARLAAAVGATGVVVTLGARGALGLDGRRGHRTGAAPGHARRHRRCRRCLLRQPGRCAGRGPSARRGRSAGQRGRSTGDDDARCRAVDADGGPGPSPARPPTMTP